MRHATAVINTRRTPVAINPAHVTAVVAEETSLHTQRGATIRVACAKVCLTSGGYLHIIRDDTDPGNMDAESIVGWAANKLMRVER